MIPFEVIRFTMVRFMCHVTTWFLLTHSASIAAIECRLLWCDPQQEAPALMSMDLEKTLRPLALTALKIQSPTLLHPQEGRLPLFHADDRSVACTVVVPSSIRRAILILMPGETQRSMRAVLVDDISGRFPDAGACVVNLSRVHIRMAVGEHRALVSPGADHPLGCPQERDDFNMAQLLFQFERDGAWRTASETRLRFAPGMRHLILAEHDPRSGRPRVRTFTDAAVPRPLPAEKTTD
jgi:hypothetical protein